MVSIYESTELVKGQTYSQGYFPSYFFLSGAKTGEVKFCLDKGFCLKLKKKACCSKQKYGCCCQFPK